LGLGGLSGVAQREPEVEVGWRGIGISLEGLPEGLLGPLRLAQAHAGNAQKQVSGCVIGGELENLLELLGCPLPVLFVEELLALLESPRGFRRRGLASGRRGLGGGRGGLGSSRGGREQSEAQQKDSKMQPLSSSLHREGIPLHTIPLSPVAAGSSDFSTDRNGALSNE
jgi:hypothetical protein